MNIPVYRLMSEAQNRLLRDMLDEVGSRVGINWDYRSGLGADGLSYLCGLPALDLLGTHSPLSAPVLSPPRYRGLPCYFTDVITRASDRRPLAARTNGSWAYNERGSFSGWVAVVNGLDSRSIDRATFDWIQSETHGQSLEMVRSGKADLCGVDSMIWDLATTGGSELSAGLAVVESFGPWPIPPLMASNEIDRELVARLAEGIGTHRPSNPLVARWTLLDDSHLDPIGKVVQDLRERSLLA
jgi:phosphonate transport system substrate-binding protein